MKKSLRLLVILTAVMLFFQLTLFSGVCHPASRNAVGCFPSFPDRDGWYGGDGAYSIPLDDERTFWLFGDTFVSDAEGRQNRVDMDVVMGTTLAISKCSEEGRFTIRYFLKKREGRFISSFGRQTMDVASRSI